MAGSFAPLADRGVLWIGGEEAVDWLQGLVSNDVAQVAAGRAVYAALLSPQGKYLYDFLLAAAPGGGLLLDGERARLPELARRLTLYKLRAKVTVAEASASWAVFAAMGDGALVALGLAGEAGAAGEFGGGVAFVDPRLAGLGARVLLPAAAGDAPLRNAGLAPAGFDDWDRLRLALGIPDGSRDLQPDKTLLLEAGFEELNGVSFAKGCYVGQELTARTKHRALLKKRMIRVDLDGPLPAPGTPITLAGQDAGELRSGRDGTAIALVRLEALDKLATAGGALDAAGIAVRPHKPGWARF